MPTITKRELVIKITDQLGNKGFEITQQDVLEVVQTLIDEITDSLAQGDTVVMRNFGAFQVREMKAKIGRNPKDPAKDVPIPARAAVKFKPGKEMEAKVAQAEAKSANTNVEIQEKIVEKTKVIREKGRDIIQYIDKEVVKKEEVIKYIENCPVPKEIIDLHNQAAELNKGATK